jgi:hypothetical protein
MSSLEEAALMACGAAALFGALWFFFAAFSEGLLWGLGCLVFPWVALLFLILHWKKAGKPFCVYFVGIASLVAWAILTMPPGAPARGGVSGRVRSVVTGREAPARRSAPKPPLRAADSAAR